MTKHDNTNSGGLWVNNRREKDTHPHLTGKLNVKGEEFWLSAWKQEPSNGKPLYSLSLKPVGEKKKEPATQSFDSFDDDIPF